MIKYFYLRGRIHFACFPFFITWALFFSFLSIEAAPQRAPHRIGYGDENNIYLRQMQDHMDDLRREVNNHEVEIRMLEEKLSNQDVIVDSFRQQVDENSKGNKDFIKENSDQLEKRISSLETSTKNLIADLRQFKTHANDSVAAITQVNQKIAALEKSLEAQNQNMENLQVALSSIMEALQIKPKDAEPSTTSKSYKVKSGDNLEKIAKNHQTTIQLLKELNGLKNDRIIVGQTLQIP